MDIPRYRIGNDLTVLWAISNNDGTPYDLSGKEVRLYVTNERGMSRVEPTIVQDENSSVTNIIRWVFLGDNQKVLGKHTLTVEILTSDEHRKIKRDICDAFTLVSRSEDEDTGGEGNALDSGAIYLSTKLDVYRFGNVRVEIGTNGNWFIDGTDTGRSALAGEKGIVNKIYQASDLGKDFDTSSVVDTFNAQAINEVYKGLKNLTIKELRDLSLADLEEYDVLTFNGQKWLNFPFRELINIFKLSVDISDDDNDPEDVEQYWYRGYDGKVHIDDDIVVHGNAIIEGDTASGGAGEDITVGLDEQAVLDLLEREKYVTEDDIAGLVPEVDLSDYYKATQVDDLLKKYYTSTEVDGLLSKKANAGDVYTKEELNPYKAWWDKVMAHLTVDENGNVTIDTNLIVSGDTASGGEGEDITVGLDEKAVLDLLEEKGYVTEEDIAGLIPDDYVNSAELTEIVNEINAKIAKKADSSALQNLQNEVDNIEAVLGMDEEAEGVINTWNEVKAFLDGYSSSDDLATILSSMNADIAKRALKSELEALGLIVNGHTSSISTINGNISNLLTRMSAEETVTNTYKDWWSDLKPLIVKDASGNIVIKTNLIVEGDTASLASGTDEPSGSGGITLTDVAGYLNANDYVNADNAEELGMATQEWVNKQGFLTTASGFATQSWVNSNFVKLENGLISADLKLKGGVAITDASGNDLLNGTSSLMSIGSPAVFSRPINVYSNDVRFIAGPSSVDRETVFSINYDSGVKTTMPIFIGPDTDYFADVEPDQFNMVYINSNIYLKKNNTINTIFEAAGSGVYYSVGTNGASFFIQRYAKDTGNTLGGVSTMGGILFASQLYLGDMDALLSVDGSELTVNGNIVLHAGNYQEFIGSGGGGSADLSNYYTKTEADSTFLKQSSLDWWTGSTNLVTVGNLQGDSLVFKSSKSTQSAIELYTSDNSVMVKTAMGYDMSMGGSFLYDISKDTWINIGNDNLYISNRYKVLHSGNYTDYLSGGGNTDLSAYLTIEDAASTYLPKTGGMIEGSGTVLGLKSSTAATGLQFVNSLTAMTGAVCGINHSLATMQIVAGSGTLSVGASSLLYNGYRVLTTADLADIGGGSDGITADTLLETAIDVGAASIHYYLSEISDVRDKFGGIPSNTVFELDSSANNFTLASFAPSVGSNGVIYIVQGLTNTTSVLSIPSMSSSNIMLTAYYNTTSSSSATMFNYSILNQPSGSLIKFTGYFVLRLVYSYNKDMWIGTVI